MGVCHYRRYFSNSRYYLSALKEKQIRQILNKYDIIVPEKNSGQYNGHTAKEFFSIKHDERVWDECLQIIKEKTPQYVEDFKWFENEKSGYCFNMCIMDKEKFDNYCQWLFGILFELEKKIDFLSSHSSDSSSPSKGRFRDKLSTRLLDALPDMLTVIDHDANIIELASSPATNHVEGISPNNITTTNVKDILPKEAYESVRKNMDKVILTGESSTARHDLMLDGVLHHYENRIFPLDKEYLLCMCRDISQQWEAEQTNAQQQKELKAARIKAEESDRLKSAFLANMSHEIRTPLNAIVGFSKLITYATSAEEKNQYSEIIERNSEMLLNLFNDILDLASLEADSLKFNIRPIKLIDICLQLEQQFCHKTQNGVKLILDDVDADMHTSGDWNRIIQIISNLLSNATKFTPKGEIHFGYREKEDFVEFYVKDSGIGIPAARIATIFRRFGKVDDFVQGSGLGLTLCRMLVEKMGGRIWLRSQEGQGSRFYFTLPLIRQ